MKLMLDSSFVPAYKLSNILHAQKMGVTMQASRAFRRASRFANAAEEFMQTL
ncbi:hypothetical protein [Mesorhizobium sp. CAU 1732]|uniref:hypothetical protein n=1 Tax=Mesorhizobium sp. CAU 1732 TaxID=3140358 RepID=UPI00326013C5